MIGRRVTISLLLHATLIAACKPDDMADQRRIKPNTMNEVIFSTSRALVPGTVTVDGRANADDKLPWTSAIPESTTAPFKASLADLRRGATLFNVYCTPCHGMLGDGDGMIVRRGFSKPPTYHSERLRRMPEAHFYNVITNGWGAMYSFNDRISSDDRWRIAAYIKSLQLSQHAPVAALESQDLQQLGNVGHAR